MDKKVVLTPLMKMLNPGYRFDTKEEEERDFQAIRMYKMEEGSTVCKLENLIGTDIFRMEEQQRDEELLYEKAENSPISDKNKNKDLYRRDVEIVRVLKKVHTDKVTKVRMIFVMLEHAL